MGLLYNSTPANTGGFTPPQSTFAGYMNLSQGLPFYQGRSQIASIPEYMRNPNMLGDDMVQTIREGRVHLMKLLFEYAQKNGSITRPDVKYRWKVDVIPHERYYLKIAAQGTAAATSTFTLADFTRPTQSYPTATGNPKVVGEIARLQAGDFIMLMCSYTNVGRTLVATVNTEKENPTVFTHNGKPSTYAPIPELCRIISVDYAANKVTVERNWAGKQRTSKVNGAAFSVVANSATLKTGEVKAKDAFFLLLPNSMKEDEIDAKISGVTQTWRENIMQRSLKAWGAGHMQEVINRNLGNKSPLERDKRMAVENFFAEMELNALWGEQSEGFDPETGDWWGTTDGLLTTIPKSHYVGIVPPNYPYIRQTPAIAWGSFDIPIFNKLLEDKGYFGSERKTILCGADAYTAFSTMINHMTQDVPDIKSEWNVTGKSFQTSGGLTVDFVPSDTMTLKGMRNMMVMFDQSTFRKVDLQGYPIDIVEVKNENPLKSNGFIHGVYSFANLNPDASWIFILDSNLQTATFDATYAENILGVEHTT